MKDIIVNIQKNCVNNQSIPKKKFFQKWIKTTFNKKKILT